MFFFFNFLNYSIGKRYSLITIFATCSVVHRCRSSLKFAEACFKLFCLRLAETSLRALALENANAILFYPSKISLYHYTILFYHSFTSQNSISIKILFFNISLLFLYNCQFF